MAAAAAAAAAATTATATAVRFAAALRSCGLQRSDRLAVALSGGPDSLALAVLTVQWQASSQVGPPVSSAAFPCHACHLIHLIAI